MHLLFNKDQEKNETISDIPKCLDVENCRTQKGTLALPWPSWGPWEDPLEGQGHQLGNAQPSRRNTRNSSGAGGEQWG